MKLREHPHATPHHAFLYIWIVGAVLVFGGLAYAYFASHPEGVIDGQHEGDVRAVVAAFGNQLDTVSLLSPDAADDIRDAYGPYVTPELLATWMTDPASVPGRETSSPWPDHIEADRVLMKAPGSYEVTGRVILMTSAGEAGSVPVSLTVESRDGSYLIARYARIQEDAPLVPERATVTAALGERVSALGVSLMPKEILEDSRCPMDAMCVQQGTVRIEAELVDGMGTSTMPFTLAAEEPVTSEIASIWLTNAEPYPMASQPAVPSDYRFTFVIERR